jgi:hypothetical protein
MSNDIKLGIGLASGMFFHAPAGTERPTYPTECVGGNGDGTTTDKFTATASQSTFTLTEDATGLVKMTVNGTAVSEDDYTLEDGDVVYSGTALSADDKVAITYYISAWRLVGDVAKDGITLNTDKTVDNIYTWANVAKRTVLSEHTETVQVPVIDTTEGTLKVVLGEDNVSVTAASGSHGKTIACNLSAATLPDPEAYLFVMKDGDDSMAVGISNGQITAVESITFAPDSAITWNPTITVLDNSAKFISEEG